VLTGKWKIVLLAACIVAFSFGVVCLLPTDEDPIYNGIRLSKLIDVSDSYYGSKVLAEREKASKAINSLGTNAIPFLIKWIQENPSPLRIRLMQLEKRFSKTSFFVAPVHRANEAIYAFHALGTNADFAVPPLTRLMLDANSTTISHRAVYALGYSQRDSAVRALVGVLTNAHAPTDLRLTSADALQYEGASVAPAVPFLVECLEDKDTNLSTLTAGTLGQLKLSPKLVVPALVKMTHRNDVSKVYALFALGEFGKEATDATAPVLLALHDPNAEVRSYATNALSKIAPELLTNTPPQ
jgi:HEAT repeat protein